MVANQDDLVVMRGDPRPMPLGDRRLRLEDDVIGLERGELRVELLGRQLRGDSVEEKNLMPGLLQHRRRRRGDDGEDVGRAREPPELAVLSEKRDPLLAFVRLIGDRDSHRKVSETGKRVKPSDADARAHFAPHYHL